MLPLDNGIETGVFMSDSPIRQPFGSLNYAGGITCAQYKLMATRQNGIVAAEHILRTFVMGNTVPRDSLTFV